LALPSWCVRSAVLCPVELGAPRFGPQRPWPLTSCRALYTTAGPARRPRPGRRPTRRRSDPSPWRSYAGLRKPCREDLTLP
jgi:hypothetical protein